MSDDTTTPAEGNASSICRPGDTVVFKYEGNMRARVTGRRVIDGRVWLEAHAAFISFLVPASLVVCVEPRGED